MATTKEEMRLAYCQFLLGTPLNYTLTYFAEHSERFSHDTWNRALAHDRVTPREVWHNVQHAIVTSEQGYLVFDDTVLDKRYSETIELVRRQYSGNEHGLVRGIGVVTCVYVNPELDRFWIVDFRIFDPDGDGKTKLDHVQAMLEHTIQFKKLPFRTVLMDTWYATKDVMLLIERWKKVYYCPLKHNRLVDDSGGKEPYRHVSELQWTDVELKQGKRLKINRFPKDHKVRCFRVVLSTQRTDYVVTNDTTQESTLAVRNISSQRWTMEQFHRESKQVTGLEKCQCRKARIQRNPIGCALLVWLRIKQVAYEAKKTIYQIKHGLLDDFMSSFLRAPTVQMRLA